MTEKTIDDYVAKRNEIQLEAENIGDDAAAKMWSRLGVANRHIERVVSGRLELTPAVAAEIERCFEYAKAVATN